MNGAVNYILNAVAMKERGRGVLLGAKGTKILHLIRCGVHLMFSPLPAVESPAFSALRPGRGLVFVAGVLAGGLA